jgi:hypothetical protein
VHVDHFKPEAGDPLHEPGESSLIGQLCAKSRRARADGDFAIVELCAKCGARLPCESDLIYMWSHQDYASRLLVQRAASVPGAGVCVITLSRVTWDPDIAGA